MDFTVYNRCCYDYEIPAWFARSDIAILVDDIVLAVAGNCNASITNFALIAFSYSIELDTAIVDGNENKR